MNDLTTAAVERLTAQLGEALFGEPGLSLMEIANRRAEIEQVRSERDEMRKALAGWHAQYTAMYGNRLQAPGHSHDRPGVWDRDNGELADVACAQCQVWRLASEEAIKEQAE